MEKQNYSDEIWWMRAPGEFEIDKSCLSLSLSLSLSPSLSLSLSVSVSLGLPTSIIPAEFQHAATLTSSISLLRQKMYKVENFGNLVYNVGNILCSLPENLI